MNVYYQNIADISKFSLPWDKLNNKNILITGATGLIGGALVEALLLNKSINCNVYAGIRNLKLAEDRFNQYLGGNNLFFVEYDVCQPLNSKIEFHYIIHAASGASPNVFANDPVGVMKANIFGVDNLLSYGISNNLEKFLYVSSGEVYGEGDGRVFTEDYSGYVNCITKRACYPSSKRAAETLCISYSDQYKIDVSIARPCHIYGPHFSINDKRVYAEFIRNIINNEDIVMKSTGEQFRSWCYVVDCISALLFVLLKGDCGAAYNIADDSSNISIRELAEMISKIGDKKVIIDCPDDVEKSGYSVVSRAVYDTTELKSLGWKTSGTMEEKMKATIDEVFVDSLNTIYKKG